MAQRKTFRSGVFMVAPVRMTGNCDAGGPDRPQTACRAPWIDRALCGARRSAPVPGRAGDGPRDGREACVGVLTPDIAARHDGDGVALALIFAHQHGAGLEATGWWLTIPREAVEDLGGLRIEPPEGLFLDVPADEAGDEVLGEALWRRRTERGPPEGAKAVEAE